MKNDVVDTITRVYEKLETIPHDQIIEAIELLTAELPPFLEQYEFNTNIPWKQWLTKYWWVPPLGVAIFGIRIAMIFFKSKQTSTETQTPDEDNWPIPNEEISQTGT